MRVLRLDLAGHRAELHRYVSVVRVSDDAVHANLIDALRAIPAGRVDGVSGLVEAYGVLLDLTPDNLSLLDIPNDESEAIDPVVTPEQLPAGGLDPTVVARRDAERQQSELRERLALLEATAERAAVALAASREALAKGESTGFTMVAGAAGAAALETPRAEFGRVTAARSQADERRDAASDARDAAEAARVAEEERVATATEQRDAAVALSAAAAAELETVAVTTDPTARAAVDVARQRLLALEKDDAEAAPGTAPNQHSSEAGPDPDERVARLGARRRQLEAALLAVETIDPLPVRIALHNAQSAQEPELVHSHEALRLADEWARINAALGSEPASPDDDASQFAVVDCRFRVENARAALADAERAARLPQIDRDDVDKLEEAHEKVLDAHDKVERRLGRAKAQTKLESAREEEQAILDRIGFLTYADFRMRTSILHVDSAAETRLEAARAELAAAEDVLARAETGVAEELARAELLSQRSQVRAAALMLLGDDPGDDLEWALRHHRITKRDDGERLLRLRRALEAAGLDLGNDDVSEQLLFEFATIWLDEQEETISQRLEIEQRMAEIDADIEAASAPVEDETDDEQADAATALEAAIDEARQAVAVAEQRAAVQADVEREAEDRQKALTTAAAAEEMATTALATAEAALFAAERAEHDAVAALAAAEEAATAARDAEAAATADLDALTEQLAAAAVLEGRAALEAAVATAEQSADQADAALARGRADLVAVEATLAGLEQGSTPAAPAHAADHPRDSLEEVEWYLLARIAAQRSVSYAGSVPLVLDDALLGLEGSALHHILGRLERMTSAVQIVVVTSERDAANWADAAGPERAMAVDLS